MADFDAEPRDPAHVYVWCLAPQARENLVISRSVIAPQRSQNMLEITILRSIFQIFGRSAVDEQKYTYMISKRAYCILNKTVKHVQ